MPGKRIVKGIERGIRSLSKVVSDDCDRRRSFEGKNSFLIAVHHDQLGLSGGSQHSNVSFEAPGRDFRNRHLHGSCAVS